MSRLFAPSGTSSIYPESEFLSSSSGRLPRANHISFHGISYVFCSNVFLWVLLVESSSVEMNSPFDAMWRKGKGVPRVCRIRLQAENEGR